MPITDEEDLSCIAAPDASAALAPPTIIHGVMMEVFGVGILIVGESGVGKSECALDLITRGHRLVSDDAVALNRIGDEIRAKAPESIRDFLEIRGIGIINAREVFGASALADSATLKLCVEFASPAESGPVDRLETDAAAFELLGLPTARFAVPVTPGRSLATLVETAVRVFLSREAGAAPVEDLIARHQNALAAGSLN